MLFVKVKNVSIMNNDSNINWQQDDESSGELKTTYFLKLIKKKWR